MKTMPIFTWHAPNIRPREGAVWVTNPHPTPWTPKEIEFARGEQRQGPKGGYKPPANVGTAFYKTLRKLGYTKEDALGDYR